MTIYEMVRERNLHHSAIDISLNERRWEFFKMNIRNLASSISKGQKTKLTPYFWESSVFGLPAQNQWNIRQLAE
jgi:hypothetical protein